MLRISVTVEEQLILKAIKEECPWENLPKRLQATPTSKEEWHGRIVEHCIDKRLQCNTSLACKVCKEGEYYEDMPRYLRKNLASNHMRASPILVLLMPCGLHFTGIGKNEFIDIMNKCRSKNICGLQL